MDEQPSHKAPQSKRKAPVVLILFLCIAAFMAGLFVFVKNTPPTKKTPIIK